MILWVNVWLTVNKRRNNNKKTVILQLLEATSFMRSRVATMKSIFSDNLGYDELNYKNKS